MAPLFPMPSDTMLAAIDWASLDTLGHEQNGCRFADGIIKRIFLKAQIDILTQTSLKCVPNGTVHNKLISMG